MKTAKRLLKLVESDRLKNETSFLDILKRNVSMASEGLKRKLTAIFLVLV